MRNHDHPGLVEGLFVQRGRHCEVRQLSWFCASEPRGDTPHDLDRASSPTERPSDSGGIAARSACPVVVADYRDLAPVGLHVVGGARAGGRPPAGQLTSEKRCPDMYCREAGSTSLFNDDVLPRCGPMTITSDPLTDRRPVAAERRVVEVVSIVRLSPGGHRIPTEGEEPPGLIDWQ